jgi:hypothetical protein
VYTATAKSKAKGTYEHGNHKYRKFMQNTRSMQKGNRGTQVENSRIAWRSTKQYSMESRIILYCGVCSGKTPLGLTLTKMFALATPKSPSDSHNLGVELGRHHGVVWFARGCERYAALGMHELPVDDEAYLLFSCPATTVVRREHQFAQLPFTLLLDLCAVVMFTGWHYLCTSA